MLKTTSQLVKPVLNFTKESKARIACHPLTIRRKARHHFFTIVQIMGRIALVLAVPLLAT